MAENHETLNADLQNWLNTERWFMRYSGGALSVIGLMSLFIGLLNNPDGERVIMVANFSLAIILAIAGVWMLWASSREKRMITMMDKLLEQPANRPIILASVQFITSILFLLEGFRGRFSFLLLGILLLTSSIWFFRRSMQIRRFQNVD